LNLADIDTKVAYIKLESVGHFPWTFPLPDISPNPNHKLNLNSNPNANTNPNPTDPTLTLLIPLLTLTLTEQGMGKCPRKNCNYAWHVPVDHLEMIQLYIFCLI